MRSDVLENLPNNGKLEGIYRGVVEDNKDPWKNGRCRVRIFGIHSDSKIQENSSGIPVDQLPWVEPAYPIWGGSSGIGFSGVPVQGSHVFVFFEAGDIMQPRYFATVPGFPYTGKKTDNSVGFADPDGEYPLTKKLYSPENNTGQGPSDYTKTFVITGHCGHTIILDSTPGNENILIKHGVNGAYIKIDYEGNIEISASPSATTRDSSGDRDIVTTGNHTLTVTKDYTISSKNSSETAGGNKNSLVVGALSETVFENWDIKASGIRQHSNGSWQADASDEAFLVSSNDCSIASAEKNVNITATKQNIKMKALLGKIEGRSLFVDIGSILTLTSEFTGLMTTIGKTSMVTEIKGQIIMIG